MYAGWRIRLLKRMKRIVTWVIALLTSSSLAWIAWQPYPTSSRRFDKGRNGLWIGHQWYTGIEVDSGRDVPEADLRQLLETVRRHRIRYLYVHAGPVRPDASVRDRPVRERFGEDYFLSHATRRAGPFGVTAGLLSSWFWSEEFYRATMEIADQTVLMGYDTRLPRFYLNPGGPLRSRGDGRHLRRLGHAGRPIRCAR